MKDCKNRTNCILSFLFLVLIAVSCQKKLKLTYSNTNKVKQQMFSIPDSIRIIELDFTKDKKELTEIISNAFDYDICEKYANFGLKINESIFPVKVYKECIDQYNYGIPMIKAPEVIINMNSKGQILYNNETSTLLVCKKIGNDFGSSKDEGHHEIYLKWQTGVPIDNVLKVFKKIKIGCLLAYSREAKLRFNESLFQITDLQRQEIKLSIPYCVKLNSIGSYDNDILPPPRPEPPPIIEADLIK